MQFLRRHVPYSTAPVPDLVLLDLNLPKKDGIEVLRDIKTDPDLSPIPIIVLTTSDRELDVRNAYRLHANCYLTKSLEIDEFISKLKGVEQFWLRIARLPRLRG